MGDRPTKDLVAMLQRFIILFIYTISVGIIIYWGSILQKILRMNAGARPSNVYYNMSFLVSFPVLIGLILATPYFLAEIKKSGTWYFDWIRFAATGAPTFIITILPLIYISPLRVYFPVYLNGFMQIIMSFAMLNTISGIAFGYLVLTNIKKDE